MSKTITPLKSIWPNGLKVDDEGYTVFYPLGTNKVDVSTVEWPEGDKLVAPFVYQNNKLVGLCDSKALEGKTFNIPYDYTSIEICGNPVQIKLKDECDTFIVTLTKATTAPIIVKDGTKEVPTDYVVNAPEITSAAGMFSNRKIKSISLYIPKLKDASDMFSGCELTTEQIYQILNSIPVGTGDSSINLGVVPTDISQSDLEKAFAEKGWIISDVKYTDINGDIIDYNTTLSLSQKRLLEDTSSIVNNECFDETGSKIGNFNTNSVKDTTNITKLVIDLEPLIELIDMAPETASEMAVSTMSEEESTDEDDEFIEEMLEEVVQFETSDGNSPRSISLPKLKQLKSDMSSVENIASFGSSILNSVASPSHFNADLSSLKRFDIDAEFKGLEDFLYKMIDLEGLSEEIPAEYKALIKGLLGLFVPLIETAVVSFLKSNVFANTTIEEFKSNLRSLENGNEMFSKSNVYSFNADLSSLRKAKAMFGVSEEEAAKFIDYLDNIFNSLIPTIPFVVNNKIEISNIEQMSTLFILLSLFLGGGTILSLMGGEKYSNLEMCQMEKLITVGELSDDSSSSGDILSDLNLGYANGISDTALSNLVENISDLSGKNIKHDEITGDAHIDITVLSENKSLAEIEEDIQKLSNKGWNCSAIVFADVKDEETGTIEYTPTPIYNYKKVSRYFVDYLPTLMENIEGIGEFEIVNGQIYDKDKNLLCTIDFKNITYWSGLVVLLESLLGGDSNSDSSSFFDKLTSFDSDLSNSKNGLGAFISAKKLKSFKGDLSNLVTGLMMFSGCESLTSFNSNLGSLEIGNAMFSGCDLDEASLRNISSTIKHVKGDGLYHVINIGKATNITDDIRNDFINKGWIVLNDDNHNLCYRFPIETQKVIDNTTAIINNKCFDVEGVELGELDTTKLIQPATFFRNGVLKTFNSDLSSLVYGYKMFAGCTNLETFEADLSSLESGDNMFEMCPNLVSFKADMSKVAGCENMFEYCTNLTSFEGDLSSLQTGDYMFEECKNLSSFRGSLASLTSASSMFTNCKLDTESIIHIADTINTVTNSPTLTLGIGNATPSEEEVVALNRIAEKGWSINVNGSSYSPSSGAAVVTLDENGEEIVTPIPYYAKPIETDIIKAKYIGEDGKLYKVQGGQFIYGDNKETYGMFTCLDDATANMRLSKLNKDNALPAFKTTINNKSVISRINRVKNRIKGPLTKFNINKESDYEY